MAERRMFAKTIIDSDAFLGMSLSAQALYFHLSMRADDEGFINNPKKIMRMIGANDADIEMLIRRRYIIAFDSGVIVIKHWRIHNYIQSDRFKPTLYQDEKESIMMKDNKSYTEKKPVISVVLDGVSDLDTDWIHSIDKSSIDKSSIDKNKEVIAPLASWNWKEWFAEFWKAYPKHIAKSKAESAFKAKVTSQTTFELINADLIKRAKYDNWLKDGGAFIPNPATYINQSRWLDEYEISNNSNKQPKQSEQPNITRETQASMSDEERESLRKKLLDKQITN